MARLGRRSSELYDYHYGPTLAALPKALRNFCLPRTRRTPSGCTATKNRTPYVKDAFHRYLIGGERAGRESGTEGNESRGALLRRDAARGELDGLRCRLTDSNPWKTPHAAPEYFGSAFDAVFAERIREADEFYAERTPGGVTDDARLVQRQAFAGLSVEQAELPLRRAALARRRFRPSRRPIPPAIRPQPRLDAPLQLRRDFHAGQVGVSLVRGVGPGVPLRGHGADRSRLRQGAAQFCCCANGTCIRTANCPPTSGISPTSIRPCTPGRRGAFTRSRRAFGAKRTATSSSACFTSCC